MPKPSYSTIQASDEHHDYDASGTGLALQEERPQLKRPPLYAVLMMNDDYTPMEFVIHVLQSYFGMSSEQATNVMLTVHTKGQAVCGVYTKDVADTKSQLVNQYAQENEHPLICTIAPQGEEDGE